MMMMMVKTCERRRRWKNQVRWTWKLWERTTYCQWMANQNHLEAIHIFSLPISSHNTSNSHSSQPTSKSTNLIHKPPKLIPTPSKSWSWSWLLILATEAQKTEKQCPPHLISPFPKWYDEKIYTEWVSDSDIIIKKKKQERETKLVLLLRKQTCCRPKSTAFVFFSTSGILFHRWFKSRKEKNKFENGRGWWWWWWSHIAIDFLSHKKNPSLN